MSLDLNKLANKLDEALSNETSETLNKFLTDKRMSNNKQSSVIKLLRLKEQLDSNPWQYNWIIEEIDEIIDALNNDI